MKKVLVVEDNDAIRQVYKMLLDGLDFGMVTPAGFTLGDITSALTDNPEIVCVICDGGLGDNVRINGTDVVRHIRSLNVAIPILAITADVNLAAEMLSAGANIYIEKPFNALELQRILKGLG